MIRKTVGAVAATLAVFSSGAADAHPSLERQEATVGAPYKAIVRVPHGCDGSPTLRVRVQLPEGVIGVQPMPMTPTEFAAQIEREVALNRTLAKVAGVKVQ